MKHARFVLSLVVCVAGIMLLASAVQGQSLQDVWTWHNDNSRTGWYQNESMLTPSALLHCSQPPCFGKIMQYNVQGAVYAEPLALNQVSNMTGCSGPCNVVFIATQQDMLYAFNADYNATGGQYPTPLWSKDLAGAAGGYYDNCKTQVIPPCAQGVVFPDLGVMSTPVIDRSTGTLYVVSLVYLIIYPGDSIVQYYIHAIDYTTGNEKPGSPFQISDTYSGPSQAPTQCNTGTGQTGTITFDPSIHYQRAALLLLNHEVYVAFAAADADELTNGWIMAFSYNPEEYPGFSLDDTFVTTPYGTGGGIWMSGAGPAAESGSNGTFLYLQVANGTFDVAGVQNPSVDYGDSLLKLTPYTSSTSRMSVSQYFTPANVFTFTGGSGEGVGLCPNDEDFGSGGLLLFPDSFYSGAQYLMVAADKQSRFYVVDRNNLTGFSQTGKDAIVEEFTTPTNNKGQTEKKQGYWGSPAYWEWTSGGTTSRAIYHSANGTTGDSAGDLLAGNVPLPIEMYMLDSSDPVSQTPIPTTTVFCGYGGQPSVSSSISSQNNPYSGVAGTGIVWGYEVVKKDNPFDCGGTQGPAALHAYDASNVSNQELYNSRKLTQSVNLPVKFATPMVFNGKVYIGTQYNPVTGDGVHMQTEVDVFGLCSQAGSLGCFTQ